MKLLPLGTGSAFTMSNFQANLLIEYQGKRLLIDAGGDIRFSLKEQKLSYKDIDAVYLSHLHADHIGGIEYLAFCSFFDPGKPKMKLIGHQRILQEAWEKSLSGGLRSIQGKVVTLDNYFNIERLPDNGSFLWESIKFDIVQSVHIMDGYSIVPSYGLMVHVPHSTNRIYITSDSQFNPNQIKDFYNQADLIIQDCETSQFKSGVHAHYSELKTLDYGIKKKMLLTHYQDDILEKLRENQAIAKKDSFIGFAEKGVSIKI